MIQTEELTPHIYSEQSRDFQLIGHLFDLILNSVKTSIGCSYQLPLAINSDLDSIELLATTLGFVPKHKYNSKQLKAVCSALPVIIRNKGSLNAVVMLIDAILNAEGIVDTLETFYENDTVIIGLPGGLKDLNLLYDLLDYIIPAGISYEIINMISVEVTAETKLGSTDKVTINKKELYYEDSNNFFGNMPDLSDSAVVSDLVNADPTDAAGFLHKDTTLSFDSNQEEDDDED